MQLGDGILSDSSHILPICDGALVQAQRILLEMQSADTKHKYTIKMNIHARMTGRYSNSLSMASCEEFKNWNILISLINNLNILALPVCPELHRTIFPRNEDVCSFLRVSGTVVRMTASKKLEFQRDYICTKCTDTQTVKVLMRL
jgi:hypothetical protein